MRFKKIASIFLTAALLLSMLPIHGSAENTEIFKVGVEAMTAASTVSASPVIYTQGEEISVKITVKENTGISSLKLLIQYDETVLEPVIAKSAAKKLFTANDEVTHSVTSKGDGYFMYYSDAYPDVKVDTGVMVELKFVAKATCIAETAVTVAPMANGSVIKKGPSGATIVPFAADVQSFSIHNIDKTTGVVTAPTCTEKGFTTYTCPACEKVVVGNIVKENGHSPAAAVEENRVEATCTKDGSYDSVVYCSVESCKAELSRTNVVIPMTGHAPAAAVEENRVEATCTTDGSYESVVYCATCKEELSRVTVVLPKFGHTAAEAVKENDVAPTCTKSGSYDMVVYCKTCKTELSRETTVVPMLGHKEAAAVEENRVEPTCTKSGSYDMVVYCEVCKAELSRESFTIPKLGHKEAAAVEENRVEATCAKEGSYDKVVYCEVCKEELSRETIVLEKLPHDIVKHDAQTATHTQIGWDAYETCKNCDHTTYKEIPMIPYLPGDVTGDDKVTDADAIYLLYATFDSENYPLNQEADYNKDGKVTDADAIYLLYATFDSVNYPLA